jgi:hypothetical protein
MRVNVCICAYFDSTRYKDVAAPRCRLGSSSILSYFFSWYDLSA